MNISIPCKGNSTISASSVSEYVSVYVTYPQPRFFARGESKEFDESFLPAIWRPNHPYRDRTPVKPNSKFTVGELSALRQCQTDLINNVFEDTYFRQFFEDVTAPVNLDSVDLFHWAALAQHYSTGQKYPTRLLDVTRDPMVALFFAVKDHPDDDGFVFYFKYNFNFIDSDTCRTQGGTFFDLLEIKAADGNYHPQDDTLNLSRPPFPNRRLESQRGFFLWTRGIGGSYRRGGLIIRIPSGAKPQIREELKRLNVTAEYLFPI